MAKLSEETLQLLRDALTNTEQHYESLIELVERQARNLEVRTTPIGDLGENTTDTAASEALDILDRVGAQVVD